jgi:hypothetical protein
LTLVSAIAQITAVMTPSEARTVARYLTDHAAEAEE